MTVGEIEKILDGGNGFVIVDSDSCENMWDGVRAENPDGWKEYENYAVLGMNVLNDKEVELYINAFDVFETWLDATYSIKVTAKVPVAHDEKAALAKIGECALNALPKSFEFGGNTWKLSEDNMEFGGFYDNIIQL